MKKLAFRFLVPCLILMMMLPTSIAAAVNPSEVSVDVSGDNVIMVYADLSGLPENSIEEATEVALRQAINHVSDMVSETSSYNAEVQPHNTRALFCCVPDYRTKNYVFEVHSNTGSRCIVDVVSIDICTNCGAGWNERVLETYVHPMH